MHYLRFVLSPSLVFDLFSLQNSHKPFLGLQLPLKSLELPLSPGHSLPELIIGTASKPLLSDLHLLAEPLEKALLGVCLLPGTTSLSLRLQQPSILAIMLPLSRF